MLMNNNEYIKIIETIKGEIRGAQYKAALSVNRELIMLYYHIGTVINEHKTWGSKFIENLAADIRIAFPNVKGYSVRNLKYMYMSAVFVLNAPCGGFCLTGNTWVTVCCTVFIGISPLPGSPPAP